MSIVFIKFFITTLKYWSYNSSFQRNKEKIFDGEINQMGNAEISLFDLNVVSVTFRKRPLLLNL